MNFKAKYNKSRYIDFFRDNLLPEDFEIEEQKIELDFKSKYFTDNGITYIGKSDKLDLAVYEVIHSSENDARVGLSRDAFKLVSRYYENNALILFVPENNENYRLSLVTIDHKLDKNGARVLKEYSNPKRYSYFLGEGAKTHTPEKYLIGLGRISDINDLKKRFSVEVVNKDFYNKIAEMFSKLVGGKRKRGVKTLNYEPQLKLYNYSIETHDKKYKEFAVRLIGRTVFCWFLKKKKSANNIPLIPEDILSGFAVKTHPDYYHSRVEPLFFEVLNTSVDKRKPEYKQAPYNTIPFLNGGLFEPNEDDFYRAGKPEYGIKVPDEWWKEFIDILEIYNFTIDENTSIDIDLSVDPEMLGRIFENLLAEINPETGETARKATGSYYTPRPIVEYMVDESLKQHIITKSQLPENKIAPLLDYNIEESGLSTDEENKVKAALDDIKVLDPACGSGAFPMGILQKMLLILQKVDHSAENSIRNILKDIKNPVYRKLFETKLLEDDDLDDYARKLNIIRRSIYGIDIQPIATEISKLRFFLSLIVDEKVQDDQKNRGIEPLPNLEFKFACANTLIPLPENRELFENADTIEALEKVREEYFISFGEDKQTIKKQFESLQKKMFTDTMNLFNRDMGAHNLEKQTQSSLLATWNPFSDESTSWFDAKWMFGVTDGFDVVLGNPPYISNWSLSKTDRDQVLLLSELYKTYLTGHWDIFICFIAKAYNLLNNNGVFTYILPTSFNKEKHSTAIRKFLTTNTKIIELLDFEEQVVFNEVARQTGIFIIKKQYKDNNCTKLRNGLNQPYRKAEQSFFKQLKNNAFKLNVNQQDIDLFHKLKNGNELLGNLVCINTGVVAHSKKGSPISFKKDDVIHKNAQPDFKKYIIGSNISQYCIKFDGDYLDYDSKKDFFHRSKYQLLFEKNKIVVRRISGKNNSFVACFDDNAYYSNDNLMHLVLWDREILEFQSPKKKWSISLTKDFDLKFLLAIINSKLNTYFFSKFLSTDTLQGSYSSIYPEDIRQIPIKRPSEVTHKLLIITVNQILKDKNIGKDTSEQEKQINQLIYKLYELSYEEVLVVDKEFNMSKEEYDAFELEETIKKTISN